MKLGDLHEYLKTLAPGKVDCLPFSLGARLNPGGVTP